MYIPVQRALECAGLGQTWRGCFHGERSRGTGRSRERRPRWHSRQRFGGVREGARGGVRSSRRVGATAFLSFSPFYSIIFTLHIPSGTSGCFRFSKHFLFGSSWVFATRGPWIGGDRRLPSSPRRAGRGERLLPEPKPGQPAPCAPCPLLCRVLVKPPANAAARRELPRRLDRRFPTERRGCVRFS